CRSRATPRPGRPPNVLGLLGLRPPPAVVVSRSRLRLHRGPSPDQLHDGIDGFAASIVGGRSAPVSERREPERKGFGKSSRVTPTTPGCRDTGHAATPQFAGETSLV